jgi:hypothetical protein
METLVIPSILQKSLSGLTSDRGCVTPAVIQGWKDFIDGDMELCEGYTDLPEEEQEKVSRALAQGHVDDADWSGVRTIFVLNLDRLLTAITGC